MIDGVHIRIEFVSHYKLSVYVSEPILLDLMKKYFETRDFITFRTRKKKELRREMQITKLWEPETAQSILIDAGLIDYLVAYIGQLDKETFSIEKLELSVPQVTPVILNDKWNGILRDNQKEDIRALTKFYGGLAAQHTGYGKTLCMLSLIESIPERCLVLVPNSAILEDVQLRGREFGIEIPNYDWSDSNKVNIINPIGFLRSNEAKKEETAKWLEDVKVVFTDEAHYLQANSWTGMFNGFLPNVGRAYGFSASPDSKDGKYLSPRDLEIRRLGAKSAKVVGLAGAIRVRRRSKSKITLVEVRTEITPEIEEIKKSQWRPWQEALDEMIMRPECSRIIAEVMEEFPDTKFYIPITTIDSGTILFENLLKYGLKGYFWYSGTLLPKDEECNKKEILAYLKKKIVDEADFRFLMTTSVGHEGVDLPTLDGIIPLVGKSYRTVMQPLGRASRGNEVVYVIIHDKHNRVMKKQTSERKRLVTKEYDVVKSVKMSK